MKTIAISIDEATLTGLDRLSRSAEKSERPARGSGRRQASGNRSRIVRQALREFLQRREILLRDASTELQELLELVGLRDVLRIETGRQAEQRE